MLPDLPTFEEQGTPGVLADNWYGLVAPPKTPPAIIARLSKAVNDASSPVDVKSKLEPLGAVMGVAHRRSLANISREACVITRRPSSCR
ncbi:tripartite tricarboxylate transporter substrate-binding protein [Bradyrhizobium sp. LHD-71]|uniref:tripartite tricarboxylate transporter substrate-binding protein n=1 Tax=Bradyrhizobium sp. LHD-71 TaxID=3072141 RepID=UPI0035BE3DD7